MGLFERTKKIKDPITDDYSIGKVNMLNQKVGLWESFDEKNVLTQKITYSSDHTFGERYKGPFEYFHFGTNIIRVKGVYDHQEYSDFRIGTCFHYYKTGELHTICNYKKHQRTDRELEYLEDVSEFEGFDIRKYKTSSVIDGPIVQFHKDGSIMLESYVTSHVPDGEIFPFSHLMRPTCIYDKEGNILKKLSLYSSGPFGVEIGDDGSLYNIVDTILDKDFKYFNKDFDEEEFKLFQKDCKKLGGY